MDAILPTVAAIVPVSPDPRNTAVGSVFVSFSESIVPASFDVSDLTLTRNGGSDLITGAVTIAPVFGAIYEIGNLAGLTGLAGNYVLTVNAAGVQDPAGNSGSGSPIETWTFETTGPLVTAVGPVTPDPRATAVGFIDVTFNELLNLASFTFADLSLTRDTGPNLIDSSVTISFLSGTTYRINNLAALTGQNGTYVLTVTGSGITDVAGNAGTNNGADTWVMSSPGPTVLSVGPVSPDPRLTNVAFVDVVMSVPINLSTFNFNDLTLTRNGGADLIDNTVTVTFLGGTTYRINNLALAHQHRRHLPADGGRHRHPGRQRKNAGTGSLADSWVKNAVPPPDLPTANTDIATVPQGRRPATIINVLANDLGSGLFIDSVSQGLFGRDQLRHPPDLRPHRRQLHRHRHLHLYHRGQRRRPGHWPPSSSP